MADNFRLSFTVGPVQSFVAQARRTRDLWTGSWLLSFLSECALVEAEKLDGDTIIPHRDGLAKSIESVNSAIGGMPNRFEVAFESENAAMMAGKACIVEFDRVWQSIANVVWDRYMKNVVGNGTHQIWKRQVDNFWELSWVVTQSPQSNQLAGLALARRKQFRNSPATIEPGTKCSIMNELQELSGYVGINERRNQEAFWKKFREVVQELDLREDERLSAIGLIKRMYPEVIEEHLKSISLVSSGTLKEQSRWPSLAFFAAIPWLKEVDLMPIEKLSKAKKLNDDAQNKDGLKGKKPDFFWESEKIPAKDFSVEWATTDATIWHPTGLDSAPSNSVQENRTHRDRLVHLQNMQKDLYDAAGSRPVPYYALLLADGDSMGTLLQSLDDPKSLSKNLSAFSRSANQIIHASKGTGRVVYSGGDDVFALLSAESALQAAQDLSRAYKTVFETNGVANVDATLSVAIVYAHWKYPLKSVIATGHKLLDDVAKEATGRDSLALGLIQGSGLSAVWSAPWKVVLGEQPGIESLQTMIDQFSIDRDDADNDLQTDLNGLPKFNSSYLYLLRKQFAKLMPSSLERPGTFQSAGVQEVLKQLAHAEYRRRIKQRDLTNIPFEESFAKMGGLMSLSQPWQRAHSDQQYHIASEKDAFGFDGWKMARFLRQIQDGRLVDHD